MKKHSLCIVSYVFGAYSLYIPYFLYSIGKSYPEYYTKIYVEGELPNSVSKVLDRIKEFYPKFQIIPARGFPNHKLIKHSLKVDVRVFYRFLIDPKDLKDFDYVYVGDVDMFILNESPSLLDFHISDLEQNKIPVSNCVRLDENGDFINRLTGLHFYKTEEYYNQLSRLIIELRNSEEKLTEWFFGLSWEEEGLYKLVNSKYDTSILEKKDFPRPWHGLHLGAARKTSVRTKEMFSNNSIKTIEECRMDMKINLRDPLLKEIMWRVYDRSFCNFLIFLEIKNLGLSVSLVLFKFKTIRFLKLIKKKLLI